MSGTYDFTLNQGETFRRRIEWRDAAGVLVPLTGMGARMQLRARPSSATVILELTSGVGGGITLTHPGVIELNLSAAVTSGLTFRTCAYDLEIFSIAAPEQVTRLLAGTIELSLETTRPVPS